MKFQKFVKSIGTEESEAKALFIKRFPVGEDEEVVGVIFPTSIE